MASVIDISGIVLQGAVTLTINNTTFTIELQWLERARRWFVNMLDESGAIVVAGRILHPGVVLNPSTALGLPNGVFYATRLNGDDTPFSRDDLAGQATLWFQDSAEYAAEIAALTPDLVGTTQVL